MLSKNHSYFYVPFTIKDVSNWMHRIESQFYETENGNRIKVWKKITNTLPVQLLKFVDDRIGYHTERHHAYRLMEKRAYGLPYTDGNSKVMTCIIRRQGNEKKYMMDIRNVKIHCFGTKVGFLVYDVWYAGDMTYHDILEFNYMFKKIGIVNLTIQNAMQSSSMNGGTWLYDLSRRLIANGIKDGVNLFFHVNNNVRMECNTFSIFCEESAKETEDKLFHLSHSYTDEYEYAVENQDGFQVYHPYPYIHWGYCQAGISCIYSSGCRFTENGFSEKLQNDYYFMYLILLHQRYMILMLMDQISNSRESDSGEWAEFQHKFTEYRMEYSFTIVTDEMPYHKIYLNP